MRRENSLFKDSFRKDFLPTLIQKNVVAHGKLIQGSQIVTTIVTEYKMSKKKAYQFDLAVMNAVR
ncbi:hypothetical protein ACX1NA_03370, partial [Mycoplasma sp. VS276A1]